MQRRSAAELWQEFLFRKKNNLEVSQVLDFKQDKEFNGEKDKVSKQIFSSW